MKNSHSYKYIDNLFICKSNLFGCNFPRLQRLYIIYFNTRVIWFPCDFCVRVIQLRWWKWKFEWMWADYTRFSVILTFEYEQNPGVMLNYDHPCLSVRRRQWKWVEWMSMKMIYLKWGFILIGWWCSSFLGNLTTVSMRPTTKIEAKQTNGVNCFTQMCTRWDHAISSCIYLFI
jgi:hypothetical protein